MTGKENKSSSMNVSVSQQVKSITLQGSATIVVQFFRYAVNSILYQRGVYASETFDRCQQYGITLFMTKDKEINEYFESVLPNLESKEGFNYFGFKNTCACSHQAVLWDFQWIKILIDEDDGVKDFVPEKLDLLLACVRDQWQEFSKELKVEFEEDWLARGELRGVSLVITSALTGEHLEKWDFDIHTVPTEGDTTITGRKREYGKKELAEIQKGIRNVMRQITATVTFLPLLDVRCAFDLRIYVNNEAEVMRGWIEESDSNVANPERVELRSFSTSVHRVQASVTYKADDP